MKESNENKMMEKYFILNNQVLKKFSLLQMFELLSKEWQGKLKQEIKERNSTKKYLLSIEFLNILKKLWNLK